VFPKQYVSPGVLRLGPERSETVKVQAELPGLTTKS